jgi:hypothetical protein
MEWEARIIRQLLYDADAVSSRRRRHWHFRHIPNKAWGNNAFGNRSWTRAFQTGLLAKVAGAFGKRDPMPVRLVE